MGAGHDGGIPVEDRLLVIEAVDAVGGELLGAKVAVQVLVGEAGAFPGYQVADVLAERDEGYPFGQIEALFAQFTKGDLNQFVFAGGVVLRLEFDNEDGLCAFLRLDEVFFERGQRFAVLEAVRSEIVKGVLVDAAAADGGIVVHYDYVV